MPNLSNGFTGFLNALELKPGIVGKIESARSVIENALREGLEAFSASPQGGGIKITPKFIPQGSIVYRTANGPCHTPPQQADFDLGCHLPVSFHEKNGEPSIAARDYFNQVDTILFQVCQKYGWKIDRSKKTCTRVIIHELIHIDIPLYSMPDEDFRLFTNAMVKKGLLQESQRDEFRLDAQIDFWDEFASDKVLLCMRDGNWKPSDPRKMAKAFRNEIAKHGEQLRRVWRYLKAWRDFQWPQGDGPSSVYLMVGALNTFETALWRDDFALLSAMKGFAAASRVPVLTAENENLSNNQKPEDLVLLEKRAQEFLSDLSNAINFPEENGQAERIIVRYVGDRFPVPEGSPRTKKFEDVSRTMSDAAKVEMIRRNQSTTRPWCP
jgi:hypothetical protein